MVSGDRPEQLSARPGAIAYDTEPGPTGIALEISASPIPLFTPEVRVNGRVVPYAAMGANHIPVAPGNYDVEVINRRILGPSFGAVHAEVPVREGRVTMVYYRMPPAVFLTGVIGPVPRHVPGAVIIFWLLVGLAI
ncbi:hypothetical protein IU501_17295 [Nocardia otitidiscaviarum]|nr:hypothetical protein [Nocardia otitidiscaviarum]MBF6134752.1 hypothetical protein [Nocardia otitidiscaviarum]